MKNRKMGFIGAGRITYILLEALKRDGNSLSNITVSDTDSAILEKLKSKYPEILITENNKSAAENDIVFISLHPPVFVKVLNEIKESIADNSIIISLAPKISIQKIKEETGKEKIVRLLPNAPTFVNSGYNPCVFADTFTENEKKELLQLFEVFGKSPEVKEESIESYAIFTAMGPTYFWFQYYELMEIIKSFGLSDEELKEGLKNMVLGAVETIFESGLPPKEVMDLVAVKPISAEEENIKNIYKMKLEELYKKLKS